MAASSEPVQDWRIVLDDPFVELDLMDSALEGALESLAPRLEAALAAMRELEDGAISNRTEQRMVGHYWLRAPALAPTEDLSSAIVDTFDAVVRFAHEVQSGGLRGAKSDTFDKLLLCGIGGSSLGPMLLADALGGADRQRLSLFAFDNTDPDGIRRTLASVGDLGSALVLVISKSGGTPETRNSMLEVRAEFERQGLEFAKHAVAVTGAGSKLGHLAEVEQWLAQFPMWDWVGGRTSVCCAVGLLPAALLGFDVRGLLAGAAAMDAATRNLTLRDNPAAALAAFWHSEGGGKGDRAMVVLPYCDRLLLFSRYLQQLVMESLGKREDRTGEVVHQGLVVYGNKGSTDQHAYVQQLRDGRHDFFAVFVRVLGDGDGGIVVGDDGATTGDFLNGFFLGTRRALAEGGRRSATLTIHSLNERVLGALIALFERAVGLYAELINVNAYDQPGVEAGKRAAGEVLDLQQQIVARVHRDGEVVVADVASQLGVDPRLAWEVVRHLAWSRAELRGQSLDSIESAKLLRS